MIHISFRLFYPFLMWQPAPQHSRKMEAAMNLLNVASSRTADQFVGSPISSAEAMRMGRMGLPADASPVCAWFWESPPCKCCLRAKVNVLAGHCPQRHKHHRDEPTGLPLQGHALGRSHSAGWNSASERLHQSLLGAKNLSCNGDETKSAHARTF